MLTVSRISIAPVRALGLHHPREVRIEHHGVPDDRRYLTLSRDGRIFDGTKLGTLVQIRAELQHDPERLSLTFPDGHVVAGDVMLGEPISVTAYSRTFAARPVIGPWEAALSAYAGKDLLFVRTERLDEAFDRHPVSIVSSASVDELGRHLDPAQPVDARRFRMLLEVAGARPHEEDEWMDRDVRIGEVVVRVNAFDPRCVITTQDPGTGLRDIPTLHTIKGYRGLRDGKHIDFGVYADVVEPGTIRTGDAVSVAALDAVDLGAR
jgi:uncharacterized protein YcbX